MTSKTNIVSTKFVMVLLAVTMVLLPLALQNASAVIYGRETSSTSNYGNMFTTKVTDMSMTNSCSYVSNITQWIALPNGDWLENGFTIGAFVSGDPCAGNSEYSYHAYNLSGIGYADNRDSALTVGNVRTYELSDLNKDKIWYFKDNGNTEEAVAIAYTSGIGQRTGGESSHSSPTIPNTHMTDIKWADSSGTWNYWSSGTPQVNSPFWAKLDCSPSYRHIHAGTTGSATCAEY